MAVSVKWISRLKTILSDQRFPQVSSTLAHPQFPVRHDLHASTPLTEQSIRFAIFRGVPEMARDLIWDTFFASRGRGLKLSTHFPWIDRTTGTHCIALFNLADGSVAATLVLREIEGSLLGRCGMVGMVCVAPLMRGKGLSGRLMNHSLAFAREQQFSALALWTTQPEVYVRHGFVADRRDSLGRVTLDRKIPRPQIEFSQGRADAARGLPPFARKLFRIQGNAASLVAMETAQGMALAEWSGSKSNVMDLMEAALPGSWLINAPSGHEIVDEIRRRGHTYDPLLCADRMVWHRATISELPYVSVLDRI